MNYQRRASHGFILPLMVTTLIAGEQLIEVCANLSATAVAQSAAIRACRNRGCRFDVNQWICRCPRRPTPQRQAPVRDAGDADTCLQFGKARQNGGLWKEAIALYFCYIEYVEYRLLRSTQGVTSGISFYQANPDDKTHAEEMMRLLYVVLSKYHEWHRDRADIAKLENRILFNHKRFKLPFPVTRIVAGIQFHRVASTAERFSSLKMVYPPHNMPIPIGKLTLQQLRAPGTVLAVTKLAQRQFSRGLSDYNTKVTEHTKILIDLSRKHPDDHWAISYNVVLSRIYHRAAQEVVAPVVPDIADQFLNTMKQYLPAEGYPDFEARVKTAVFGNMAINAYRIWSELARDSCKVAMAEAARMKVSNEWTREAASYLQRLVPVKPTSPAVPSR